MILIDDVEFDFRNLKLNSVHWFDFDLIICTITIGWRVVVD